MAQSLADAIRAIEHPCHDACVELPSGETIHADCQCAAYIRQEVLALLDRPAKVVGDFAIYEGHKVDPDLGVCLVCGEGHVPEGDA